MGGQYEEKIPSEEGVKVVDELAKGDILAAPPKPKETEASNRLPSQVQEIRHHLSGKEAHFHVDAENLKVVIPPVRLDAILDDLRELRATERAFYDKKNGTILRFKAGVNESGQFDLWVGLESAKDIVEGPVITTLDNFLNKVAVKKKK